jgi:hypothetical protein
MLIGRPYTPGSEKEWGSAGHREYLRWPRLVIHTAALAFIDVDAAGFVVVVGYIQSHPRLSYTYIHAFVSYETPSVFFPRPSFLSLSFPGLNDLLVLFSTQKNKQTNKTNKIRIIFRAWAASIPFRKHTGEYTVYNSV